MIFPYPGVPKRMEIELAKTDMLPLWFRQINGNLGVPLMGGYFDCLPDVLSRVDATTLVVVLHVSVHVSSDRRQLTLPMSGAIMTRLNGRSACLSGRINPEAAWGFAV